MRNWLKEFTSTMHDTLPTRDPLPVPAPPDIKPAYRTPQPVPTMFGPHVKSEPHLASNDGDYEMHRLYPFEDAGQNDIDLPNQSGRVDPRLKMQRDYSRSFGAR